MRKSHCVKRFVLVATLWLTSSASVQAQNSTRKIRVQPNELAQKIGTSVQWAKSLDAALRESEKSGKPVFWYVSTVPGTFMDRKTEIDRYMLGGFFSWPPIIEVLNKHFIPLRVNPGRDAVKYKLRPYKFVEPGFIIINSNGEVIKQVDQITTLHHQWFLKELRSGAKLAGVRFEMPKPSPLFEAFSKGRDQWIDPVGESYESTPENLLLSGMIAFRKGDHELAIRRWKAAATADPEDPLAWKAALEAQGLGPFYRGFETFRELSPKALASETQTRGTSAPKGTYSKSELTKRSVDFLLGMIRQDGAIVDSDYDFGGTDSLPNVHVAVTSLVGMALLKVKPELTDDAERIDAALAQIAKYISDSKNINPADRDEILWAHSYRLRFLSRLLKHRGIDPSDRNGKKLSVTESALANKFQEAISDLENIQLKTGNWYHEYSNPFVSATALCALYEAQKAGGKLDKSRINRGVKSLLRDRFDNGAYPYSSTPGGRANRGAGNVAASAGRMPICELALVRFGEKRQDDLKMAVETSFRQHRHLASAYKYDNHTSNMAYGGFFFWYDMRSRSEALNAIEKAESKMDFRKRQNDLILQLPEIDGCFVDSHELGRCYGTAMALLSLE